ncbi:hypothetical protein ACPVPU_01770 [Sphingomonas sp. CJ99]
MAAHRQMLSTGLSYMPALCHERDMDYDDRNERFRELAVSIEHGVMAILVAGAFIAGLVGLLKALF